MGSADDWYDGVAEGIGALKGKLSDKDYKKSRLGLLGRVAKRVADFSADCGQCERLQGDITELVERLGDLVEASKERRKSHLKVIGTIIKHLQKQHKLVREGDYVALGISMGLALGVPIGVAFGVAIGDKQNVALGLPIGISVGMGVGVAVGSFLEAKAKKEGKVI